MLRTQKQVRPQAGVRLVGEGVGVSEGTFQRTGPGGEGGLLEEPEKDQHNEAALEIVTEDSSPFFLLALKPP